MESLSRLDHPLSHRSPIVHTASHRTTHSCRSSHSMTVTPAPHQATYPVVPHKSINREGGRGDKEQGGLEELGCVRSRGNQCPQDSPHMPPLQTRPHNRSHTHRNTKQVQSKEHLVRLRPQLPSQSPQTSVFPATLTQPLPIERRHLEALLLQVELSGVAPAPRKLHDAPHWPCRRRAWPGTMH